MTTINLPLNLQDRDRLIKLISMATSPHNGEALSAVRKANEFLASKRLTWADVLQPAAAKPSATADHHRMANAILASDFVLNEKERGFVESMMRFTVLRPKQTLWLDSIVVRFARWSAMQ